MKNPDWNHIEPGDIGFDGGVGVSGWLIRRATGAYGHCFVYHEDLGQGNWRTIEAGPLNGVIYRVRSRRPNKVVRLWNDELERARLLAASEACVGAKYGWGEIARIVLHLVGIKYEGRDNPNRMICSNHVATAAAAVNKATKYTLPYKPYQIWPQKLAEWCDWFTWSRARNAEREVARERQQERDRRSIRWYGVDKGYL